jgi:nucleoside-diphosphate-sugar epimerase
MKVLVAGATGVVGQQLLPLLVANGHQVGGLARSERSQQEVARLGGTPVPADALDAGSVLEAVQRYRPEVIVHQLTALSGSLDLRHFDRSFALTNRLRTEGTDHLLAAGRAVGVRRFVAQSYTGWPFARTGGPVKTELDPLDDAPPAGMRQSLQAIRYLERTVTEADWTEGIVLRYGSFYGPGTSMSPDGEHCQQILDRKFPVVGKGGGVWSFTHVADTAQAALTAIERGRRGIYQIVDDDPAPVGEWLPEIAAELGAPAPWHVPRWVGRLLAGEVFVSMMTDVRGASNAKAKRELGWQPVYPSWRGQFRAAPDTKPAAADKPMDNGQRAGTRSQGRTGTTA